MLLNDGLINIQHIKIIARISATQKLIGSASTDPVGSDPWSPTHYTQPNPRSQPTEQMKTVYRLFVENYINWTFGKNILWTIGMIPNPHGTQVEYSSHRYLRHFVVRPLFMSLPPLTSIRGIEAPVQLYF